MTLLKDIYNYFSKKNYKAIWEQFATEKNGTFINGKHDYADRVEIPYKGYSLIFDTYVNYSVVGGSSHESEYTRARLEFVSPDGLKFRLLRQNVFDSITKIFGAKDIKIGHAEIDRKYIISGTDKFKIQEILLNTNVVNFIISAKDVQIELLDTEDIFNKKIAEGYSLLYYISEIEVTTINQLNQLYILFTAIVDQLIRLGSAKPKAEV
jgi:hypothetical protein